MPSWAQSPVWSSTAAPGQWCWVRHGSSAGPGPCPSWWASQRWGSGWQGPGQLPSGGHSRSISYLPPLPSPSAWGSSLSPSLGRAPQPVLSSPSLGTWLNSQRPLYHNVWPRTTAPPRTCVPALRPAGLGPSAGRQWSPLPGFRAASTHVLYQALCPCGKRMCLVCAWPPRQPFALRGAHTACHLPCHPL